MKHIAVDDIPSVWGGQRDRVIKGLDSTRGRWHERDVLAALLTDSRWGLWVHENAVVITRIVEYPRKRVCEIFLASGEKLDTWSHFEEMFCSWARSVGCQEVDMSGRRGWERIKTNGWKSTAIKMTKEL